MRPGVSLRSTFLAADVQARTDSRGTPYLSMTLVDKTGSVDARMWKLPQSLRDGLDGPEYVRVEGNAHEYRGMLQVKLERLEILKADEVEEEAHRLLEHRPAQLVVEGREPPAVDAVVLLEAPEVEPVAGELRDLAADAVVAEHAPGLGREHLGLVQVAGGGVGQQLLVGQARP